MMDILPYLFLLIQLCIAGFFLFLCLAFVTGGPFVPSTRTSVEAMIRAAGIKPGMTVYDVGSGDGRVLFAAAAKGATAVGIEINIYLVWYTRIRAYFSLYRGRIHVRWGDLWKSDLSRADRIFVYLIPWRMADLAAKISKDAKPGVRVVSNSFIFPEWKTIRRDRAHHVYTFAVSAKRS